MYNEEFISKEQLEELEKKADELNALIKKLKNKNRLADYCMLRPLNTPRNIKDDIPVFGFKDLYDTEVWNCFCKLAKAVHNNSNEFYMSTAYPGSCRKYIRDCVVPNPKKFEELTMEQMELSGKMVDELIAIYNKHFISTHAHVVYDEMKGDGKMYYPVLPPKQVQYIGRNRLNTEEEVG